MRAGATHAKRGIGSSRGQFEAYLAFLSRPSLLRGQRTCVACSRHVAGAVEGTLATTLANMARLTRAILAAILTNGVVWSDSALVDATCAKFGERTAKPGVSNVIASANVAANVRRFRPPLVWSRAGA